MGGLTALTSLILLLLTIRYEEVIVQHIRSRLASEQCRHPQSYRVQEPDDPQVSNASSSVLISSSSNRECIYLVFGALFPWPLWAMLATYSALNCGLVVSALHR